MIQKWEYHGSVIRQTLLILVLILSDLPLNISCYAFFFFEVFFRITISPSPFDKLRGHQHQREGGMPGGDFQFMRNAKLIYHFCYIAGKCQ